VTTQTQVVAKGRGPLKTGLTVCIKTRRKQGKHSKTVVLEKMTENGRHECCIRS
jgi:hypothetical protein